MARVAIVGRPNVGKSTLFNRLVGRREAIVADQPGVTRDVKAAQVTADEGQAFTLLDTGGLWSGDRWQPDITRSIEAALADVDLVLFCVDGRSGPTAADQEIADWLRATGRPVLLVATKLDDPRHEERPEMLEFYALGFGPPLPTSAEHIRGIEELREAIQERLPETEGVTEEASIRIAIIGRPNAGKSSLLNALVGAERVLVADQPGTTRDSVDVSFTFAGRSFVLVDTAGIRRKPSENVEYYARLRSEQALREADVAVLVVDPFEFGDHELRLANLAFTAGKPVVLAINKWDLVTDAQLREFRHRLEEELAHLEGAPWVFTSAKTDFGLHELLATAVRVYESARRRVPTSELNSWLELWTQRQAPPNFKGRPLKLFYATQPDVAPPVFLFSVNNEGFLTRAYEHYLRNRIREDLGFAEVPVRLIFKARGRGGGKRVRL